MLYIAKDVLISLIKQDQWLVTVTLALQNWLDSLNKENLESQFLKLKVINCISESI